MSLLLSTVIVRMQLSMQYLTSYTLKHVKCSLQQIKHCDRCQRLQPLLQLPSSELHPIPVKPEVWYMVGMDLIGPFKKSKKGNQHILTMTCYFSKWVEAFALPDKTAGSVAKAVYTTYCRHGAPNIIITDQGREFVNQVGLCRLCLNVEPASSAYKHNFL